MLNLIISLAAACVFSVVVTGLVRGYALKHSVIDEPNERSSHSIPTPRGGGLSITLSVLVGVGLLALWGMIPEQFAVALGGGGVLVSVVGWIDDHRNLPAIWRAVIYSIAAVWALTWIGGLDSISIGFFYLNSRYLCNFLAILGIVWLTNLYNFMDGTDGIAATQATTAAVLSGMLFWLSAQPGLALICFVLASSCIGFLVWNWPPARIFMGDVGSCLIGFAFALLAIIGEKTESVPVLIWIILLSVFVCDATLTLMKRIVSGEQWYRAHRSHAYQRLVQLGLDHRRLALWLLLLNVVILWPFAYVAYYYKKLSLPLTLLAVMIMTVIWIIIQWRFSRFTGTGS